MVNKVDTDHLRRGALTNADADDGHGHGSLKSAVYEKSMLKFLILFLRDGPVS